MNCPRDHHQLQAVPYEAGVFLDRCVHCGGVYLDAGELEKLEDVVEAEHAAELQAPPDYVKGAYEMARRELDPEIRCPRCGQTMNRREYGYCSQLLIDVCPSDEGIWLEAGELDALERFFEYSRQETSSLRERFLRGLKQFFRPTSANSTTPSK